MAFGGVLGFQVFVVTQDQRDQKERLDLMVLRGLTVDKVPVDPREMVVIKAIQESQEQL